MVESTVVICAYALDRWDDLAAALVSLRQQTVVPTRVVVVVDHNPALLERIRNHAPDVTSIANRHRRGLSGARNTGVEEAIGEVVAFLDDDAVAATDWLECLLTWYSDPNVLGVGGSITPSWPHGARPPWFPPEFDWVVGCSYRGMPDRAAPVRNFIGANMSYQRAVFAKAGCFREGLGRLGDQPLGCEETEFSIRALRHFPGSYMLYAPNAHVDHHVSPARTRPRYFLARCWSEGLSKADVTHLTGAKQGLSSERTYTLRTLPLGVASSIAAAFRGDLWGFARMIAIVVGFVATSAGYVYRQSREASRPALESAEPRHDS